MTVQFYRQGLHNTPKKRHTLQDDIGAVQPGNTARSCWRTGSAAPPPPTW
ncbi:MAG: hypothetical protein R2851_22680 [Caldilineaceae bacterium]